MRHVCQLVSSCPDYNCVRLKIHRWVKIKNTFCMLPCFFLGLLMNDLRRILGIIYSCSRLRDTRVNQFLTFTRSLNASHAYDVGLENLRTPAMSYIGASSTEMESNVCIKAEAWAKWVTVSQRVRVREKHELRIAIICL